MIDSISLSNFQSHKDSTLKFSDGVNAIVGSSDSGKTAILRAIRKLAFNKPSGDEMKSHWGGKMQIEMLTDDAHVVYSKDREAEYILGDTHFKAFGTEVPQEIGDALNLNTDNVQSQLDAPYLLSETAGAVASHFNAIAHLEVIDRATSNINSAIRELTSDIKYSEGQEVSLKGNLEKFQYLEQFESEVQELEGLKKQYDALVDSRRKLQVLVDKIGFLKIDIDKASKLLPLEKPVNDILVLIELRAEKDIEAVKLDKLIVQIKEVRSKLTNQNAVLSIEKPVDDLLKLYKEKETLVKQRENLNKALTNLRNTQDNLNKARVNYASLTLMFEKEMGSVCILCGQKIENHK
jgi:DNA repair exonuclease SbcCD ATPase subunit